MLLEITVFIKYFVPDFTDPYIISLKSFFFCHSLSSNLILLKKRAQIMKTDVVSVSVYPQLCSTDLCLLWQSTGYTFFFLSAQKLFVLAGKH